MALFKFNFNIYNIIVFFKCYSIETGIEDLSGPCVYHRNVVIVVMIYILNHTSVHDAAQGFRCVGLGQE